MKAAADRSTRSVRRGLFAAVPSVALLVVLGVLAFAPHSAGAPVVHGSGHVYDAPAIAPLDVRVSGGVDSGSAQFTGMREWSASPSDVAWGTSTTPLALSNATNAVRYGPHNPGPLVDDVASTFRSGSYTAEVLEQELTLYRVYGGKAGPIGSYWSRTAPSGPMQAQLDSALNPAWGNTATQVSTIRVPAGTTIYDGVAAAQSVPGGGTLLGGGSQVYIPKVDPAWLVP